MTGPDPARPCGVCGQGPWNDHSEDQAAFCTLEVVRRWQDGELSYPYSEKGLPTEIVTAVLLGYYE